ncbi:MAG TPA: NAD-dependent succinate-semialdehyde dehydrogenase [Conexibacter sp.]|jgi:succinate-semialdehyde dehydrogenase/glutarate-semialdehyde dehydrogenase|nr:NAD-dependent succinate-semialdehyde dehydrogenase [Conexibacter sp.]
MTVTESEEARVVAAVPSRLYVDGEWREGAAGTLPVEDPATGATLCEVADATEEDALAALAAADRAFASWRATAPRERSDVLRNAYELTIARRDELALLMTLEMGKPLAESRSEVVYAANFLRWYAEEAVRIGGRFGVNENGVGRVLTLQQPVGPCVFVTPWNFPLAMGTRKLAPALAAGCTCVVKPARQTPLSMLALTQILEQAGVPAGVVNVVTTRSSGPLVRALLADPRARKLSFTGSTDVGKLLIAQAAEQVLRVSMELGGNAPLLVFEDADLDLAVEGAVLAKTRNGGEACTSANRMYVHERVADAFAARLAERLGAMRVGRGTEAGVEIGPLIDEAQRGTVEELVGDATDRGARVLAGGARVDGPGCFFAPTVLVDVPAEARVLHEEIFGPVAPIVTFRHDDEAIAVANDTEYGLVAYVFTRDVNRAFDAIERLDAGMIGFNQGMVSNAGAPFGGVKHSGFGREGGPEGLQEYLATKYVAMNLGGEAVRP